MRITLNGESTELPVGSTVATLPQVSGSAVAVNGTVVPRGRQVGHRLQDGDLVEIVTAVQGG